MVCRKDVGRRITYCFMIRILCTGCKLKICPNFEKLSNIPSKDRLFIRCNSYTKDDETNFNFNSI